MMPLMIAGWPFKKTAGPASKGLEFLLNSFFVFFFTGFVVSVNLTLIKSSLDYSSNLTYEDTEGKPHSALESIATYLNNQNIDKLIEATDIGSAGFLLLVFSSIFGFIFLKEVDPMARKLSGGAISGVASQIGGRAGSMAKGLASKATKPLSKAYHKAGGTVGLAGAAAKHLGNAVGDIATAAGKGGKTGSGIAKFGRKLASLGSKTQNFAKKTKQ